MTMNSLSGFAFEYIENKGPRTLLVLHGTGGDELQALALGALLDEHARLLAPRGTVMENGMARFFKRIAPGMFDRVDLKLRTEELADFIVEMEGQYPVKRDSIIGVGYSNGANILLHLLCLYPEYTRASILFRPMSAALSDDLPAFDQKPIFIAAGKRDHTIPLEDSKALAETLVQAGADVTLYVSDAGHELTTDDIAAAREWLQKY